ncbi:hypothetical protein L596_005050 [Steinernema carpocapsae]|uniref:protein-tyrosine-phosphatase n=1 Tax=Steinernema carpocapsae TaxID=34508 RepID=A0A4U8UZB5_STECR|nr:hypothetical protein L596_005050 [Steinernema carpocapsae]
MCSVNPTTSNARVKQSSLTLAKKKLPVLFHFIKRNLSIKTYEPKPPSIDMEEVLKEFVEKESKLDATMIASEFNAIRIEQESWRQPGSPYTCFTGRKISHIVRNRYRDILPYDTNRVKLRPEPEDAILEEDEEDGYINASHVVIPNTKYRYIAAQAPLMSTLNDWWKMIFQNDIHLIVMLCKLVEKGMPKCQRYYPPAVNAPEEYGGFHVEVVKEDTFHEYVSRVLRVRHPETGEEREITQLHYSEWPDHGCPDGEKQVLEMIELMCKIHGANPSTILIHCSAGCGRTGTIIAINTIREQILAKSIKHLNLYELVIELRKTRLSMVQTSDQYHFLHKCVVFYCKRYLDEAAANGTNGTDHELVAVELAGNEDENGNAKNDEENGTPIAEEAKEDPQPTEPTPAANPDGAVESLEKAAGPESDGDASSQCSTKSLSEASSQSSSPISIEANADLQPLKKENGVSASVETNDSAECVIVKL